VTTGAEEPIIEEDEASVTPGRSDGDRRSKDGDENESDNEVSVLDIHKHLV